MASRQRSWRSSRMARIASPTAVEPGSRQVTTSRPPDRSHSTSGPICDYLPAPSIPSSAINRAGDAAKAADCKKTMADVDSGRLADWEQPAAAGYGVRAPREPWALTAVDQAEKGRGWLLPRDARNNGSAASGGTRWSRGAAASWDHRAAGRGRGRADRFRRHAVRRAA